LFGKLHFIWSVLRYIRARILVVVSLRVGKRAPTNTIVFDRVNDLVEILQPTEILTRRSPSSILLGISRFMQSPWNIVSFQSVAVQLYK